MDRRGVLRHSCIVGCLLGSAWLVFSISSVKVRRFDVGYSTQLADGISIHEAFNGVAHLEGTTWAQRDYIVGYFISKGAKCSITNSIQVLSQKLGVQCNTYQVDKTYLETTWKAYPGKYYQAPFPITMSPYDTVSCHSWKTVRMEIEVCYFAIDDVLYVVWHSS